MNYGKRVYCVSTGRVVLINYGPDEGKLATIIDVVDGQRVRAMCQLLGWFSLSVLRSFIDTDQLGCGAVLSLSCLTLVRPCVGLQALIDGPYTLTGVSRQTINFKRVALTDFKVKIGVNAGHKALTTAWTKGDIKAKWAASAWGQRLAKRVAKAETSDFDRFAAMITKQNVRAPV